MLSDQHENSTIDFQSWLPQDLFLLERAAKVSGAKVIGKIDGLLFAGHTFHFDSLNLMLLQLLQGRVVRKVDSAIQWIVIF